MNCGICKLWKIYGLYWLCIDLRLVTKVENELYIILMQKLYIWVYIHDVY